MALPASGEPVTRAPMSSLSSRRFSYVLVSIIPAPATAPRDFRVAGSNVGGASVSDRPGAEAAGRTSAKRKAVAQAHTSIFRVIVINPLQICIELGLGEQRAKPDSR